MKRYNYVCFLLLFFCLIFLGGCFNRKQNSEPIYKEYINPEIKVSLKYPSNWKADEKIPYLGSQPSRYFGLDGFFAVNVIASDEIELETIAKKEAESGDYGENPQTKRMIHNARIGYLIFPSSDQRIDEKHRSCFITELRSIYRANQINFDTFILFADQDHLMELIEFLEN